MVLGLKMMVIELTLVMLLVRYHHIIMVGMT